MGVNMTFGEVKMNNFEQDRADKLKRLHILRIFNAIGMVAWKETQYGAEQKLRMLHPLSWFWLVIMVIFSIFAQGIPDTISDLKDTWKRELVWW
jgi:hypothetical protein